MTWDHPRGYDPVIAVSEVWRAQRGVEIVWDKRSLQDFESFPIRELAKTYDLLIIDHPHIGQAIAEQSLAPLDGAQFMAASAALERASVGPSWRSYAWQGRQWALPIDAAAQVLAWRPDFIEAPPRTWSEVLSLARLRIVNCPMRAPHSLMTLFTLTANLGRPCTVDGPLLIDREVGGMAVEMMRELVALIDGDCFSMDPIDVLDAMAQPQTSIACAPYVYGYVNYAQRGFRARRIRFSDIPTAGSNGPAGSALGGTGIAISAFSTHPEAAADFAFWVASAPVQSGLYAEAGGQPGNGEAWRDVAINRASANFYADTRATLDHSWLRPRHNGYMQFQHASALRLNEGLQRKEDAADTIDALNTMFAASFQ